MFEVLVNGDDVVMIERPGKSRFAHEPIRQLARPGVKKTQLFDRDRPVQVALACDPHDRRSTVADLAKQLVPPHNLRQLANAAVPRTHAFPGSLLRLRSSEIHPLLTTFLLNVEANQHWSAQAAA
jgi:hypothetical protein